MTPGGQTIMGDYERLHDEPDDETKEPDNADVVQSPAGEEIEAPKGEEAREIVERAKRRYEEGLDRDKDNRDEAIKDKKFCFVPGEQWEEDTKQNERKGRICLEINQLPQFVNQVVNDLRQNRAGIHVTPEGGGDDGAKQEAERRQGIIRGIEYESRADTVYDQGGSDAVVAGRGWWRVLTEYRADRSFDQRLVIRPIADFSTVVADLDYLEPDGSDRGWAFVTETMTKAAFEAAWPDAQAIDWSEAPNSKWFDGAERIVVADYYERVCTKRSLVLLSDGTVYLEGVDPPPPLPADGSIKEVRRRPYDDWRVRWFKFAGGQQILAEYAWKGGTIIPVICCVGNEAVIEGERRYWGLIRFARDPQRMYNFAQSTIAETVALSPKSPWMLAEGQDEGYEQEYELSNRRNYSVMHYKPRTHEGNLLPAPQRNQPAQVPTGLVEIANVSRGDLRSTIGIYDPSLGQKSNETSGIAIQRRAAQGDVATFNFPDNQARAISLTGRVIDELLPHYYDGEMRQVPTVSEDGKPGMDTINVPTAGGVLNGLSKDKTFTIRVEAGPSYQTQRQEGRESMMAFVQAFPPAAPLVGDLIAKQMDWEGADAISERLELMLPPQIQQALQAKKNGGQAPQIPPEVQQQMQQLQGQLQQMQQGMQQLQARNQELESGAAQKAQQAQAEAAAKQRQAALDAQAREQQAQRDAEVAVREAQIKASTDERIAIINARTKLRVAEITQGINIPLPAMENGDFAGGTPFAGA